MTSYPLPAQLTLAQARALQSEIDAAVAVAAADGLCLDASALAEFDTSAIALLLHAQRAVRARALPLQVLSAPLKLQQLARLYGVAALLPLAAEGVGHGGS